LGIGSNLGESVLNIAGLCAALRENGVEIEAGSALYETAPREIQDQPSFVNAAARVRTLLGPQELLDLVKRIEPELGRQPGVRFGPRVIDCDLLLWSGGMFESPTLTIPHPRLGERRFALVPLLEIDPDLSLPNGSTLAELEAAIDPVAQPVDRIEGRRLG
jgi:2-amino-4-hydroxy-6-hydroxymethyldihydropteridine diphosphokinase